MQRHHRRNLTGNLRRQANQSKKSQKKKHLGLLLGKKRIDRVKKIV